MLTNEPYCKVLPKMLCVKLFVAQLSMKEQKSSFVLRRSTKVLQVWNDIRVNNDTILIFG